MTNYRRAQVHGGTYFFTVVTHQRRQILTSPESRAALRAAIEETRAQHPFQIDAWVLLPDHLHTIWTLPDGDADYPKRWGLIKALFTKQVKSNYHDPLRMNESKQQKREATVWQRRYWEHQIRDDADYRRHVDYIHYNPVKHGLVKSVSDWPHSTFHNFVARGVYPQGWGGVVGVEAGETRFGE